MKYVMMIAVLSLAACADTPRLTSPEDVISDRAAHDRYLASIYDPEFLADCEYHDLEEC
jgi:hypothetical protein